MIGTETTAALYKALIVPLGSPVGGRLTLTSAGGLAIIGYCVPKNHQPFTVVFRVKTVLRSADMAHGRF